MRKLPIAVLALSLLVGTAAAAQPAYDRGHASITVRDGHQTRADWGRDYGDGHHWRRGQRIGYNDWNGASVVDYREHHLRHPPRGYEWRESNGQYVLAAVATGVIASIILDDRR